MSERGPDGDDRGSDDSGSVGDERMRGDTDPADHRSFNQRLRDRFYGRRPAGETGADEGPAASARPKVNQMGFFGRVQRPGGFDEPPEEPVELEGELPWELGGEKRAD
ncbi:hypothetical protein [Herbiconiux flava]|uniref:Uncharacterized protein n=1 Tax=Herbiconiux flava TaxID=881268 RepID=A0A852SN06_9MICO|nr:hypothetical protein [Herbiconiux flava]NYD70197.1 hypothetical protein [Herbiconiux flava]GLK16950.1 hypothetical protein GCM10017602_14320 [Herbiconiux flava]